MKRLLLSVAILTSACSMASADNFRLSYGNRGQAITGYTTPNYYGGFNAYGYDTSGNSYRFSYQPTFSPQYNYGYSNYGYYNYTPTLNQFYQSRGIGYGYRW